MIPIFLSFEENEYYKKLSLIYKSKGFLEIMKIEYTSGLKWFAFDLYSDREYYTIYEELLYINNSHLYINFSYVTKLLDKNR